ncbi:MAG: apolipoprotein N-acyltransferase [Deltaproteobacteria bacterium]|nr:apolipoprotein N-acyltransferase [Deltaproteobacteria bacterium]
MSSELSATGGRGLDRAVELGLALLAGGLGALAFPFVLPGLGARPLLDALPRELLILPAAAILYRLSGGPTRRRGRVLACFVAGVCHFGLLLYWLDIAMVRYGHMPQWQAVPALALLVCYCALYWGALPIVRAWLEELPRLGPPIAFALAVLFLDWLRGVLFSGFPWGLWGYSQARNLALLQLARLAGVSGISFVLAVAAGLGAEAWQERKTRRGRLLFGRLCAVLLSAHAIGAVLLWTRADDEGDGVRATLVQGNIEQGMKNRDSEFRAQILSVYLRLSAAAEAAGAELVVWPEASWPGHVDVGRARFTELHNRVPTLLGASTYRWAGDDTTAYNSALWVDTDGHIAGRYDKQHLVPFGEYVPLRFLLPVEKLVPGMVDFSAGASAAPVGSPATGVLICFDGIFPGIARAEAAAGATLLANLTNDGWYGVSSAPFQHRDFYVLRAVETDRHLLRAANNGLSLFISPDGRTHQQTTLNTAAIVSARVWPRRTTTPYVRLGDWLPAAAIGCVVGALLRRFDRWGRSRRWRRSVDNTAAAGAQGQSSPVGEEPPEPPSTLH